MLLSAFTSPRRLALLAVFVFIVALAFLSSSPSYQGYLPDYKIPGYSKSSNEEDQGKGKVEAPAKEATAAAAVHTSAAHGDEYDWTNSVDFVAATSTRTEVESTISELPTHSPSPSSSASTSASTTTTLPQHASMSNSSATYAPSPLPHAEKQVIDIQMQGLLHDWHPPASIPKHWPSAEEYVGKDYNPRRWEGFEWNTEIYTENGIERLQEERGVQLEAYHPYPEYDSEAYKNEWQGDYVHCVGPRGKRLNESADDIVKAFTALPTGFPDVFVGSAEATGVNAETCFDRYHRYGPYGYGEDDSIVPKDWERTLLYPTWESVGWGRLQDECVMENQERFAPYSRTRIELATNNTAPDHFQRPLSHYDKTPSPGGPQAMTRTAVVIRAYEGYTYTPNDIIAIRSMIAELSLRSGGEYSVFLFVNVKDNGADLDSETVRHDFLRANIPRELQDIAILWNERIMEAWYPDITDWQVYWHQFMPLQWFMETHTEFDFVWNWETDARYTGNHYHFLSAMSSFALQTPRKYLWERNARYYIPSAHGNNYTAFLSDTDYAIEAAWRNDSSRIPIWGPQPFNEFRQNPIGPKPPVSDQKLDAFSWGVGEEADLITLLPIFSPVHTKWEYRDKIWNFIPGIHPVFDGDGDPSFTHPDFINIDRRVYINTVSRFSRRQIRAMHLENLVGRTMQAEMWPATVALHHGLKAVYAPHPIWADRHWPAWYADAVFNADGDEAAAWGQREDSVYNHDREWNFAGWSWYYASRFPRTLYRRWLGWGDKKEDWSPLRDLSGEDFETQSKMIALGKEGGQWDGDGEEGGVTRVGGNGRMCLPGMLLHPVKKVVQDEGGD
nr:hypothetical protein B0A51_08277 [Rachicladosporium sp. CCFEE 5018]